MMNSSYFHAFLVLCFWFGTMGDVCANKQKNDSTDTKKPQVGKGIKPPTKQLPTKIHRPPTTKPQKGFSFAGTRWVFHVKQQRIPTKLISPKVGQKLVRPSKSKLAYDLSFSKDGKQMIIGSKKGPHFLGTRTPVVPGGPIVFILSKGTPAGGSFTIVKKGKKLLGMIVLSGSGVPVLASERGHLTPQTP